MIAAIHLSYPSYRNEFPIWEWSKGGVRLPSVSFSMKGAMIKG